MTVPPPPPSHVRPATWQRRLLDVLLLPLALVVVVLEDVVWRGIRALLRRAAHFGPVMALERVLARLPGWAALPLFLVPEGFGRLGEIWAFTLLFRRHVVGAVIVYVLVRLVATVCAVFIYHACEPALMRLPWFAKVAVWVRRVRDWALARVAPLKAVVKRMTGAGPGFVTRRFTALRRWLQQRTMKRS